MAEERPAFVPFLPEKDGPPAQKVCLAAEEALAQLAAVRREQLELLFAVEEAKRIGFALGTVGDSVVSGEESFAIEWDDSDEVRFVVRAFDRPVALAYRLMPPLVKRRRTALFQGYLQAISPLYSTPA